MNYIDVNKQLANEQISQVKASMAHWEVYGSPDADSESKHYRLYSDPFDRVFKDKFMDMLREDSESAKTTNLVSESYNLLFLKYLQLNRGQVYNVGTEYKNLYYRFINQSTLTV